MWETKIWVPHFHTAVTVYLMQEDNRQPTVRQREVLASLEQLRNELVDAIQSYAVDYYRRIDSAVNFAEEGRAIDEEVLHNHYRIRSILIPEIRQCPTNYFFASYDCDWEEERGMQILFADGEIVICGESTTLPFSPQWGAALSLPTKQQQINFIKSLPLY